MSQRRELYPEGRRVRWLPPGRFRPSGYNPVELSRSAVGPGPLVFQSPTRVALAGSAATLNPSEVLPQAFHPPNARFTVTRNSSISSPFAGSFGLGTGIPHSASHDGCLGASTRTTSSSSGYELSKPTTHESIPS